MIWKYLPCSYIKPFRDNFSLLQELKIDQLTNLNVNIPRRVFGKKLYLFQFFQDCSVFWSAPLSSSTYRNGRTLVFCRWGTGCGGLWKIQLFRYTLSLINLDKCGRHLILWTFMNFFKAHKNAIVQCLYILSQVKTFKGEFLNML